jgi:hypothetical protein
MALTVSNRCVEDAQAETGKAAALPSPGFYPEISGFFEALGFFGDFYFKKSISGFFFDF